MADAFEGIRVVNSRPVPVPDEQSAPYWDAAADGVLSLARCARCARAAHPPGPVCPHCGSTDPSYSFASVPGRGTVRSWTVVRQSFLPGFDDDLPFVLVDVALDGDDDIRLVGRLVDGPQALLRAGDAVEPAFEHLDGGIAVPAFRLAGP